VHLSVLHAPCGAWLVALVFAAAPARADLGHAEALALACEAAPSLRAQHASVAGSTAALPAAASLPDPRLSVGVENLPIAGADRFNLTRDTATMQRLALMQEVPNRAKREARLQGAQARVERDRAALALATLAVQRDASLAWLSVHFAQQRGALVEAFVRENRLLQDTLAARIAGGSAQPAELTMARQDALVIADRSDDFARELRRARAELRRWVGPRGDEPLAGDAQLPPVDREALLHDAERHAELAPYEPMRAMARAELAEADAERRGDWSWEIAYNRRPRYDDMLSFQVSIDLPWQRERRQQPMADAKRRELERVEAERDDTLRRHLAEMESMLAELDGVEAQFARADGPARALAAERVSLTLASYQAGRADLSTVLVARTQALDIRLRAIDLDAQRAALRVRLATLAAE